MVQSCIASVPHGCEAVLCAASQGTTVQCIAVLYITACDGIDLIPSPRLIPPTCYVSDIRSASPEVDAGADEGNRVSFLGSIRSRPGGIPRMHHECIHSY
jgi:hypothetical protein